MSKTDAADQNSEFNKLSSDLSSFGLSLNQSKVYLFLLSDGKTSAGSISKSLGLHRVDVYRKIRELQNYGLLETHVSTPKKYSAVEPRIALSSVLHRQALEMENAKRRMNTLIPKLVDYKNAQARSAKLFNDDLQSFDSFYSLVVGRMRYYREIKRLVRSAQDEVLRIVSAGGVIRTFKSGLYEYYVQAKKRGVRLRLISEITNDNRNFAKRLSSIVDVRHLEAVHLRFTVIDDSVSVLSARFDENSLSLESSSDSYLVLRDPKFTEAFRFFFEHLWKVARPID